MSGAISLSRIWSDDDLTELRIVVAGTNSSFANSVYVGHDALASLVRQMLEFRCQVVGTSDIRLGAFGPEYASGGFHAHLEFRDPGRLFVSTHQQDEFQPFPHDRVANEARLYLVSEPVLLDRFAYELQGLAGGTREEAQLLCPIAPGS
ncbi:hypothetical protein ASE35_04185 [Lysobacter sp. Root916]|uniref:hypothetical protein n=1 Tax=Lysobacter sp. Root916 TaxID=1736606 RepID=UPI000710D3B0|nr:hypothetical protein [Lysobacter sp. Root916]KRD39551.1 hypothetical protein ASE35_04185 [Lysobacter sp. Root916]